MITSVGSYGESLAREESYFAAAEDAQDADSGLWGTC
jgi:hypothetical protein